MRAHPAFCSPPFRSTRKTSSPASRASCTSSMAALDLPLVGSLVIACDSSGLSGGSEHPVGDIADLGALPGARGRLKAAVVEVGVLPDLVDEGQVGVRVLRARDAGA